jgi:hypothetical protein
MLRRMTASLSAVVVVLLAAAVPTAIFPTAARAAENCLAQPAGPAPDGGYWYNQTNPITRQKCWMIGSRKTAARGVALPALFNFGSASKVTQRSAVAGCLAAPSGQAPRSRRWVYRVDNATGQHCWRLRAQVSRIANARPARSHEPAKLIALKTPPAVLPQAVANARAEFVQTVVAPIIRIERALARGPVTAEVTDENPATSNFESRWVDPQESKSPDSKSPVSKSPDSKSPDSKSPDPKSPVSKPADSKPADSKPADSKPADSKPADFKPADFKPVGRSEIQQVEPPVRDDAANSTNAGTGRLAAEPSLDVTLLVFLGSLAGALILFGLASRSFLFSRRATLDWPDLGPPQDILRVADFSGPSGTHSPGIVPANARQHTVEPEWQIAVDDLLRQVGGDPADQDPSRAQRRATGDRRRGDRRHFEDN